MTAFLFAFSIYSVSGFSFLEAWLARRVQFISGRNSSFCGINTINIRQLSCTVVTTTAEKIKRSVLITFTVNEREKKCQRDEGRRLFWPADMWSLCVTESIKITGVVYTAQHAALVECFTVPHITKVWNKYDSVKINADSSVNLSQPFSLVAFLKVPHRNLPWFPVSCVLTVSLFLCVWIAVSLRVWPAIQRPPLAPWRDAHSPSAPCQRTGTGRSDTRQSISRKGEKIEKTGRLLLIKCHSCSSPEMSKLSVLCQTPTRGRRTTSAVPWMHSWSSVNATAPWCTSDTPTRTTGQSARSWGSGGTPWGPTRSSSTTIWPSR